MTAWLLAPTPGTWCILRKAASSSCGFDEDEGQDYNPLYTTQGRGIVFLSNERIKYLTITPDGEFRLVQEEVMVY